MVDLESPDPASFTCCSTCGSNLNPVLNLGVKLTNSHVNVSYQEDLLNSTKVLDFFLQGHKIINIPKPNPANGSQPRSVQPRNKLDDRSHIFRNREHRKIVGCYSGVQTRTSSIVFSRDTKGSLTPAEMLFTSLFWKLSFTKVWEAQIKNQNRAKSENLHSVSTDKSLNEHRFLCKEPLTVMTRGLGFVSQSCSTPLPPSITRHTLCHSNKCISLHDVIVQQQFFMSVKMSIASPVLQLCTTVWRENGPERGEA